MDVRRAAQGPGELIEASRMSPDLYTLNFNYVNVLNGLLTTGDIDEDGKISLRTASIQDSVSDKNKNGAAAARHGWQGL